MAAVWLVLALLAVVAELHSRTLYLLALAAALIVAAGEGALGWTLTPQLAGLILVSAAGFPLAGWFRRRLARVAGLAAADLGQDVQVVAVGRAGLRVFYRGTEWDATVSGGTMPSPGDHLRIAAVNGSILELKTK